MVATDTGPSVIRLDILPEEWTEYASRAPPRTQVSEVSGRLLQVNAEVFLTISGGGTAMECELLVVKALSVPLVLRWDLQRNYVGTISLKKLTITKNEGTCTVAVQSWTGNTRRSLPRQESKPKTKVRAIQL